MSSLEPARLYTPRSLAEELVQRLPQGPRPEQGGGRSVVDPACGDGELLIAVLRSGRIARGAARYALFGFDVDPDACRAARARLSREAGLPAGALDANIRCADALDPRTAWPRGADVVANPPWGSFSGRQAQRGDRPASTRAGGWPSLHGAFLTRIADHIGAYRASASVLVPASLLELGGYAAVRRAVTRNSALVGAPRELGEQRFRGVIEPAALVVLAGSASPGRGSEAAWTALEPSDAAWCAALAGRPRLAAEAFADVGVHTGNAARELVSRNAAPAVANLREGRDVHAFALGAPRARLETELTPTPQRRFRIAPHERYTSFPILVRQTADRPIAALHTRPTYFRNSALGVRSVPELDPAFVVAILNGPVATAWHRATFIDARQRAFPQVKVAPLRSQPFPITRRAENPPLHDGLARAARQAQAQAGEEGHARRLAELAAAALAAFELDAAAVEQLTTWLAPRPVRADARGRNHPAPPTAPE